jgi:tRNA threonylcarbamoyladenosine biosynthesis protein TsaE
MVVNFLLQDIDAVARQLVQLYADRRVWAFHGEMGAGKTTFIEALCRALGVADAMSSPTFSIINEYRNQAGECMYHMDWYRLKNEQEALQAGVEDAVFSGHVCFIEWPDRAPGILPEDTLHVYLQMTGADARRLEIK